MHSQNKKIVAGLILMILAIILYLILHDISNLYCFRNFSNYSFFTGYKKFREFVFPYITKLSLYAFINNHLVDLFWFISFTLIFTNLFTGTKKIKILFLLIMACLSELSQFFFPNLGTFDILDLLSYFAVIIIYLILGKNLAV